MRIIHAPGLPPEAGNGSPSQPLRPLQSGQLTLKPTPQGGQDRTPQSLHQPAGAIACGPQVVASYRPLPAPGRAERGIPTPGGSEPI